mgnify:CR=1 FL=1
MKINDIIDSERYHLLEDEVLIGVTSHDNLNFILVYDEVKGEYITWEVGFNNTLVHGNYWNDHFKASIDFLYRMESLKEEEKNKLHQIADKIEGDCRQFSHIDSLL